MNIFSCDQAVNAARTCLIFHFLTDKYTGFITDWKNVDILHFRILLTLHLGRHLKFERLLIVWGHWTLTAGPKHMMFHILKKINLASFLIQEVLQNSTSRGFYSLLKKIFKRVSGSVQATVVFYGHFRCFQVLYSKYIYIY